MRSFRARLKARPTVGVVLQSASPLVANSMSAAGFDWLVIDPINSPLSQPAAFAMQTAVGDASPTPVLMRVGGPADRSGIQQATVRKLGNSSQVTTKPLPMKSVPASTAGQRRAPRLSTQAAVKRPARVR